MKTKQRALARVTDTGLPWGWRFKVMKNRRRTGGFFIGMLAIEMSLTWAFGLAMLLGISILGGAFGWCVTTIVTQILKGHA